MRAIISATLCVLLIWVGRIEARNLYVALNGNNSNPGTLTQPWRTISYAVSSSSGLHAGDTLIIRQGNYPEAVYPEVSGTATQFIHLRRLKHEIVTLNSGLIRFDSGVNYWKVWGLKIRYSSSSGVEVTGTHPNNSLYFQKITSSHNKQNGFYLSGGFGGITILDCNIQFNGELHGVPQVDEGHGIVVYGGGPAQFIIRRNLIANNWHKGFAFGSEVPYSGNGSQVDSNMIINNYKSGCDFSPDNSYFRYNFVSRNGQRDTENGEFGDKGFMTTPYCNGSTIAFNIFKSNGGNEIAPLGNANFYYNNTLYKDLFYSAVPGSPYQAVMTFYGSTANSSVFRNNIFCNMLGQDDHHWAIIAEYYTSYSNQTWSNNLYWCPNAVSPSTKPFKLYGAPGPGGQYKTLVEVQATWPGEENNSIYVDPGFVSGPDSNFTLQSNSPAIDAGTNVGFPYQGNAPDIGRFEYFGLPKDGGPSKGLFETSGAVLMLKDVGSDDYDYTIDPVSNQLFLNCQNGANPQGSEPGEITLQQNSPNPFNPVTTISFELRTASQVSLKVYNAAGRLVSTLVNSWQNAGSHEVLFDGSTFASGVYLYRLEAGGIVQTQRMVLTK